MLNEIRVSPVELPEQDISKELTSWKQETRRYLLKDVIAVINYAVLELERIDFIWGRIRSDHSVASPVFSADIRVEGHLVVSTKVEIKLTKAQRNAPINTALQQYCVLNQILEFHKIIHCQMEGLAALKMVIDEQRHDLQDDRSSNDDVEVYVEILEHSFQKLDHICQMLRNAANVLWLPSCRRFPYCSYVDHSFKPALPPEVVVDFSIHHGELLVEAFSLATSQREVTSISESCASKKELVGFICVYRGHKVEIVKHARVSVPIPQLEEMVVRLNDQIAWLVHARDNVKAMLDCQVLEIDN